MSTNVYTPITCDYITAPQPDDISILNLQRSDVHPPGQTIRIHDSLQSHYRVKDDRITQINRTMGPIKFTINVEDSVITADKKYLTTRYTVYYFNPQHGRLANVASFTDTQLPDGQADLPAARRIISAENDVVSVRTLTFANHRLL